MVRVSASILGFLYQAKREKISDTEMIARINSALDEKKNNYSILHLDIEDGSFVSGKSFTPSQVRKIRTSYKKEAHLMVVDYNKYIKEYFDLAEMFIVHNEIIKSDFPKTIEFLKRNKKFVGISINPQTSVDSIKYLDKIDLILVMSVNPGLPGQKFIEYSLRKIKKLKQMRDKNNYKYVIEVDGGIDSNIAKKCEDAGANIVVIGSHLFS